MTEEEFDDELLAPPSDVATDPAPVVDDPAAEAEDKWLPAHGFSDARLAVRIWVEESSRQITRVHVSPRWREVLGPNRGLDAAFGEAFFAASVRVGGDASLPTFSTGDIQDEESHHSWPDEEEVQERVLVLLEKQAALAAPPARSQVGPVRRRADGRDQGARDTESLPGRYRRFGQLRPRLVAVR